MTAPARITRHAAEAHRREIAGRFGERILQGDAVFLAHETSHLPLPYTAAGEQAKSIGGFNSWMLRQVMRDRGWKDARFFTPKQIDTLGGQLKAGAPAIWLQYVSTVGPDSSLIEPEICRFPVFNASYVDGVPAAQVPPKWTAQAVSLALRDDGIELDSDPSSALARWVAIQRENLGDAPSNADEFVATLADCMALSTVMHQVSMVPTALESPFKAALKGLMADDPTRLIQDPGAFYHAVRLSQLASARAISLVRQAEHGLAHVGPAQAVRHVDRGGDREMAATSTQPKKRTASPRVEALFEQRQAILAVPYKEKDKAQSLGAVFYPPRSVWFVPAGVDIAPLKPWDPRENCLGEVASEREILDQFARDLASLGLAVPDDIKADGQWHNVQALTKKGKNKAGAYVLDLSGGPSGTPRGMINNKHTGESMPWTYEGPMMTPEQKARFREAALQRAQVAEKQAAEIRHQAAIHASEILQSGLPADDHPYVVRKGISAEGLCQVPGEFLLRYPEFKGEDGGTAIRAGEMYLVVPMKDLGGELKAVQAISPDGSVKSFMRGAPKRGMSFVLGAPSIDALATAAHPLPAIAFSEGLATAASWRAATSLPTVVCFDAGNLEVVAEACGAVLPARTIPVLAVDNDQFYPERALGLLASRLGVNPNSRTPNFIELMSGMNSTRAVGLGDAIANGEWQQAPRGRYRMSIETEGDSHLVRAISLELLQDGQDRAYTMNFSNRGVEAGRIALERLQCGPRGQAPAVMVVPEFADLSGRPTDWNDLASIAGVTQVRNQAFWGLRHLKLGTTVMRPIVDRHRVAVSMGR